MIHAMVKVGAFPILKELKDFEFDFQPSINSQQSHDFATLRFIKGSENIVFLGPSGVGKTHLASAIGIEATKKHTSTYFVKCHDLIRLEARLKHYAKYKLLIFVEMTIYLSIRSMRNSSSS